VLFELSSVHKVLFDVLWLKKMIRQMNAENIQLKARLEKIEAMVGKIKD